MVCYIGRDSYDNFLKEKDILEYVQNVSYISIRTNITRKNLADHLYGWLCWYVLWSKEPIYLTILSDNQWYANIKNSNIINKNLITIWKDIPINDLEAENYILINKADRLWKDIDLEFNNLVNELKNYNFKLNTRFDKFIKKEN